MIEENERYSITVYKLSFKSREKGTNGCSLSELIDLSKYVVNPLCLYKEFFQKFKKETVMSK
jgi:hypothetical protein